MHRGPAARFFAAVATLAALTLVVSGGASPALADTIGGEQLANTHRTVSLIPGGEPLPDVWAETWIIADAKTGEVLAQKGSHVQRPPASTLKMLTALTVLPRTSPDETYVATERAAGIYGARVGLKPGRTYTLDQLWYAVFLPSANDAALAVAEANGGVKKTIKQMNQLADVLQAHDTVARTPNGLDKPRQVSSAYDLALIARAGMAREDFSTYAGTKRAMFPNVKGKGSHPIYTTNRLLLHGYRGMLGVKTGFTSKAGRTYVGAARRGGTTLLVTLMGIHESSEAAARKLLDWGFANRTKVLPVGVLVDPIDTPVAVVTDAPGTSSNAAVAPHEGTPAAANPSAAPTSLSTAVLWGAGALALILGGVFLLALFGRRRSRGRHAAT